MQHVFQNGGSSRLKEKIKKGIGNGVRGTEKLRRETKSNLSPLEKIVFFIEIFYVSL